jgi:hypothetical protein
MVHINPKYPASLQGSAGQMAQQNQMKSEGVIECMNWICLRTHSAFTLPLSQSENQFEQLLRSEEAAKLLGNIRQDASTLCASWNTTGIQAG